MDEPQQIVPLLPGASTAGGQALAASAPVVLGAPSALDAERARALAQRVAEACGKVLVGMEAPLQQALAALFAGGHVLLEGPPGVAKTLFVRTLAAALGLESGRIQFTPDLMPSDITGTSVFHPGEGAFRFRRGPLFAQFLLADEINRAPAKTQAALLEAMQEGTVTVDGERWELPRPFAVFATQNPIEHEGTYPLPEAQLDRFLFKVLIGYPAPADEERLLALAHARAPAATPRELGVVPVTDSTELAVVAAAVEVVSVRADLSNYVVRLLGATRADASLRVGASPRAGVMLVRGAKALAALAGRDFLTPDDLKAAFLPAMRHRVVLDPAEEIHGVKADEVLARILDSVEVPR